MPSTIAWLDLSREEQRRMREVINLFSQTESRDELGIGQVRDSFSDQLFRGPPPCTHARGTCFSSHGATAPPQFGPQAVRTYSGAPVTTRDGS